MWGRQFWLQPRFYAASSRLKSRLQTESLPHQLPRNGIRLELHILDVRREIPYIPRGISHSGGAISVRLIRRFPV
jgi:hypothetical protein